MPARNPKKEFALQELQRVLVNTMGHQERLEDEKRTIEAELVDIQVTIGAIKYSIDSIDSGEL